MTDSAEDRRLPHRVQHALPNIRPGRHGRAPAVARAKLRRG